MMDTRPEIVANGSGRSAGILCHISSLPGKYGIGGLGKEAYEFVDFLKNAHVKYWQILPVQQTGYGDSPYQSVCCRSGNPYFLDLESLMKEGLLDKDEVASCEKEPGNINYGELYNERFAKLRLAYARFNIKDEQFVKFIESGEFEDYALFMSLKSRYTGSFDTFPDAYKYREQLALSEFRASVYKSDYCFWQFLQFEFKKQWKKLKDYANSKGVKIIGDIPLYVAYDSSDVWGRPELFQLDAELKPTSVAGVPPDYFSKTGQLWGNPLYNWNALEAEHYGWWIDRIRKAAEMYDVIRIDHFRGFDRYYSIPANSRTAEIGRWRNGPKEKFFWEVKKQLGDVEIIAEDLGEMDDGVLRLRTNTGFPGMKIMLFAFDGQEDNSYLPQNIGENSVVYTGTHDNNTALGFLKTLGREEFREFKKRLRAALDGEGVAVPFVTREETALALCECALATDARLAIIPIQDLVGLDDSARMNRPSTSKDNWRFRLASQPSRYFGAVMKKMVDKYGRN